MTQNQILIAMLNMTLTEAKETTDCLALPSDAGQAVDAADCISKIKGLLAQAAMQLNIYESKTKDL